MLSNGLVELVAADPDTFSVDYPGQGDDRHLSGASADVNDHIARGLGDGQPGTNGRSHRFFDQVDLTGASRFGRFLDRSLFHLGYAGRNTDDDSRPHQGLAVMDLLDKISQHLFGDVEVGNDTIFHRPNGNNAAGGPAKHFFSFHANRQNLSLAHMVLLYRHHRWLANDDTFSLQIDQSVGGTEVNSQIVGKHAENDVKKVEHDMGNSFQPTTV